MTGLSYVVGEVAYRHSWPVTFQIKPGFVCFWDWNWNRATHTRSFSEIARKFHLLLWMQNPLSKTGEEKWVVPVMCLRLLRHAWDRRRAASLRCYFDEEAPLLTWGTILGDENISLLFVFLLPETLLSTLSFILWPALVDGRRGCSFFRWHDGEVNQQDKKIIKALLRRIDAKKSRERFLVAGLVVSVCVVFILVVVIATIVIKWSKVRLDLDYDQRRKIAFSELLWLVWLYFAVLNGNIKMFISNGNTMFILVYSLLSLILDSMVPLLKPSLTSQQTGLVRLD